MLLLVANSVLADSSSFRDEQRDLIIEAAIVTKYLFNSNNVVEVDEQNYPEINQIVSDLSVKAGIKKPLTFFITKKQPEFFDKANACAVGDKNNSAIFIGSWIVNGRTTEEIEGILAHEITHIQKDHVMKNVQLSLLANVLSIAVSAGTSVACSQITGIKEKWLFFLPVFLVSQVGVSAFMANYSRKLEKEADIGAIDLTNHDGLVQSLERIETAFGRYCPYSSRKRDDLLSRIFASHPLTKDRAAYIKKYRSMKNELDAKAALKSTEVVAA